jgi:hypothetical protein
VVGGGFGSVTVTAGGASDGGAAAAGAPLARALSASCGGIPCAAPLLRYEVVVVTSDLRGAGTDGVVWVMLEGSLGSSGWTRLEASADNVSWAWGGGRRAPGAGEGCSLLRAARTAAPPPPPASNPAGPSAAHSRPPRAV